MTWDVTKVTYNMYSSDTCCMSREKIEMNDLDYAMCHKSRRNDTLGIYKIVNEEKTKDEQCSSSSKETKKTCRRGLFI